jgi:hypothetical protein
MLTLPIMVIGMVMVLVDIAEPWTPAQATERIRAIASGEQFSASYKVHAKDQLLERNLIIGDVVYLLKNGFVYERPEAAARKPFWRSMYDAKL